MPQTHGAAAVAQGWTNEEAPSWFDVHAPVLCGSICSYMMRSCVFGSLMHQWKGGPNEVISVRIPTITMGLKLEILRLSIPRNHCGGFALHCGLTIVALYAIALPFLC